MSQVCNDGEGGRRTIDGAAELGSSDIVNQHVFETQLAIFSRYIEGAGPDHDVVVLSSVAFQPTNSLRRRPLELAHHEGSDKSWWHVRPSPRRTRTGGGGKQATNRWVNAGMSARRRVKTCTS